MVLKKISEMILNRSNSYQYYKRNCESLEKTNRQQVDQINRLKKENQKQKEELDKLNANKSLESEINKLNEINDSLKNEIDTLKSSCSKYEEDNTYLKSLLKFEIESIEKYMFELVELNNKQKKKE